MKWEETSLYWTYLPNIPIIGTSPYCICVKIMGLRALVYQAFPTQVKGVMQVFGCATERPFSYLIFDLHTASSDDCRQQTAILPSKGYPRVFVPVTDKSSEMVILTALPPRFRRQFTSSKEDLHLQRQDQLRQANADQVSAISEVILNALEGRLPISPTTVGAWHPQKQTLRAFDRRKTSLKRLRDLLMNQKGAGFWQGLDDVLLWFQL